MMLRETTNLISREPNEAYSAIDIRYQVDHVAENERCADHSRKRRRYEQAIRNSGREFIATKARSEHKPDAVHLLRRS